jgi:hypothetical protein
MKYQEENDRIILMFSALMHDINHTGKNNDFEHHMNSDLAIRYNDVSVISLLLPISNFKY